MPSEAGCLQGSHCTWISLSSLVLISCTSEGALPVSHPHWDQWWVCTGHHYTSAGLHQSCSWACPGGSPAISQWHFFVSACWEMTLAAHATGIREYCNFNTNPKGQHKIQHKQTPLNKGRGSMSGLKAPCWTDINVSSNLVYIYIKVRLGTGIHFQMSYKIWCQIAGIRRRFLLILGTCSAGKHDRTWYL